MRTQKVRELLSQITMSNARYRGILEELDKLDTEYAFGDDPCGAIWHCKSALPFAIIYLMALMHRCE